MNFSKKINLVSYNSGLIENIRQKRTQKRIAIFLVIFMFFQLLSPYGSFLTKRNAKASLRIKNPHQGLAYNYKSNLHAHTNYGPGGITTDGLDGACTDDDGSNTPQVAAQWYQDQAFKLYALTGHVDLHYFRCDNSNFTSAQQTKEYLQGDGTYKTFVDTSKVQGTFVTASPSVTAGSNSPIVWAGPSMELNMYPFSPVTYDNTTVPRSANGVHVGMINLAGAIRDQVGGQYGVPDYNVLLKDGQAGTSSAIKSVVDNGGIVIVNHPETYHGYNKDSARQVVEMDGVTGVEARSGAADFSDFWDEQLKVGNYVWGFGNDDGHSTTARGRSFIVINSSNPNPTKDDFLGSIKAGNFIVSTPLDANYEGHIDGTTDLISPVDNYYDLNISTSGGTITATTLRGGQINWIEDGIIVKTSTTKTDTYIPSASAKYVRAEALVNGDTNNPVAFSQPLLIENPPVPETVSPGNGASFSGASSPVDIGDFNVKATDPLSRTVAMRPVYRKSGESNWHNFGCLSSAAPNGESSSPFYDCATSRSYGISDYGYNDSNRDGLADFVASGSTYSFPGTSANLSLDVGNYEWSTQAVTESRIYSDWSGIQTFTVGLTPTQPTTHTVSFDSNGGSSVFSVTGVSSGATISTPTAPTKSGYTFAGWYKDSGLSDDWVFGTDTVTTDITLYAKWTEDVVSPPTTYSVAYDSNGGSSVSSTTGVTSGATITAPTAPTKSGYTFAGWYKDSGLSDDWNFGTDTVTSDITLYAKWSDNTSTTYTVTLDANDGVQVGYLTDIVSGSTITKPDDPIRSGYTFVAWYKDSGLTQSWNFSTDMVTSDITLYAKWTQDQAPTTYTVTFNSNGGSSVSSKAGITSGATITTPTAPTKSGYTFAGWYKDSGLTDDWVFSTDTITSNITLYAKWTTVETSDFNASTKTASKSGATVSFSDNTKLPSNLSSGLNLTVQNGSTHMNPEGKSVVGSYDVTVSPAPTGPYLATVTLNYPTGTTWKEGDTVMYWDGSVWSSAGITAISHTSSSVTFTTTHFTEFGIVTTVSTNTTTNTTTTTTSSGLTDTLPRTGANILNILINLLLAIACYAGFTVFIRKSEYSRILG